ncbi:bola protein [Lipomyces chichibuensis]|uniref:bola protein n=1 Tax=Lipomyces chichibuensis TaxID=1546026 RepID=UPI003343FA5E
MSGSGIASSHIEAVIRERLNSTHVQVDDISGGCGQAFEVIVVSPLFAGKNVLMRHRLVNAALKEEISAIHAFTQKDYTPEEWEKKQQQ